MPVPARNLIGRSPVSHTVTSKSNTSTEFGEFGEINRKVCRDPYCIRRSGSCLPIRTLLMEMYIPSLLIWVQYTAKIPL